MRFKRSALKQLLRLPQENMLEMLNAIKIYEDKQQGYIRWLEKRPGYRLWIDGYRAIFRQEPPYNTVLVLGIRANVPLIGEQNTIMDIEYELLGKDKVVISLRDFEGLLDVISYDKAEIRDEECFTEDLIRDLVKGQNRLKALRKYRKLSQIELQDRAGIGQGLISEIERGKKKGSISTLRALARALEVEVDDLL
jgi:DNA-binding XRE family transcriptional regulator/mRNA-degrading endonuclease RelE of RelBE toxin-antitoxin system